MPIMAKAGLVIGGRIIQIPGVTIIGPGDEPWCKLNPGDYRKRQTSWPRQFTWHTTKGIDPVVVLPGAGKGGRDKVVGDFYNGDPDHNGVQLVIDDDGSIAQLAEDLMTVGAFQATTANDIATGIEVYQGIKGEIYQAQLDTVKLLAPVLSREMGLPHQYHSGAYTKTIVARLKDVHSGCEGVIGHYGHRDQAWKFPFQLTPAQLANYPQGYAARGRGDPGDPVMAAIGASGAEGFDFNTTHDIDVWKARQAKMNKLRPGSQLTVDGVPGPGTMAALHALGFADGRALDAA